jgi:hypothetical protein
MSWLKNLLKEKENVQPIKDTIVEYSNGVRVNFTLLARVVAAKRERNEITHFPSMFYINNIHENVTV